VAPKHITFTYDVAGQMKEIRRYAGLEASTAPLVVASTYGYDRAGRLTDLTHEKASGAIIADYAWGFDKGNRLRAMSLDHGNNDYDYDFTVTYDYDGRDQLAVADYSAAAGNQFVPTDESYGYDDNGNRLLNPADPDTSSSPDGKNNQLETDGTYRYAYDDEGNRIARFKDIDGNLLLSNNDEDVTLYAWDHRNRLTTVTGYSVYTTADPTVSLSVQYAYDVFDRRTRKLIDADGDGEQAPRQEWFIYDGDDIVLQFVDPDASGDPVLRSRLLHGPAVDMILADEQLTDPANLLWPLADHLGSVRDLVDSTGAIQNHLTYDSFGNIVQESAPSVDHIFAFTGRERDDELWTWDQAQHRYVGGQYYYRARYYDPATGRFLSQDPIGIDAGDPNFYRYVGNGPTNATDPSGLAPPVIAGSVNDTFEFPFPREVWNPRHEMAHLPKGTAALSLKLELRGLPDASYDGLTGIGNLTNLRVLALQNIPVSDAPMDDILRNMRSLNGLEEVTLDAAVRDNELMHLAPLKNLRVLDLADSDGFTDEGLTQLVNSLPRLQMLKF
jgi:RHS repeat-associated protein